MLQVWCGEYACPQWFLASIQSFRLYPLIFQDLTKKQTLLSWTWMSWILRAGTKKQVRHESTVGQAHGQDHANQMSRPAWRAEWNYESQQYPSQQKTPHSPLRSILETQKDSFFSFCMRCVRFCFCFINLAQGIHLNTAQLCPVYVSWPRAFHLWGGVIIGHRCSSHMATLGHSKQYIHHSGR